MYLIDMTEESSNGTRVHRFCKNERGQARFRTVENSEKRKIERPARVAARTAPLKCFMLCATASKARIFRDRGVCRRTR